MTHPTPEELHRIAYGLSERPPHLEQCDRCRQDLDAVDAERLGLRGILQKDVDAALAAPPRRRGGTMASVAAAGLFLGLLLFFIWRPGTMSPTRPSDDVGPLL